MRPGEVKACPFCGARFVPAFTYDAPPPGEVAFDFSATGPYRRQVLRCQGCDHFVSVHEMDMAALYQGAYVDATYGAETLRAAFDRIVALPPERSDNAGRVRRVLAFAQDHFAAHGRSGPPSVLDVGAGLCVFLHRIRAEAGWRCTALDTDPRQVAHARDCAGVDAVLGAFGAVEGLGRFDVITFNKVLEHVERPTAMLVGAAAHLAPGGFVYVELPDGEAAAKDGPGREEFFIEHHHVFSPVSLEILVNKAGFQVEQLERLREPSGKYTLCAFLTPR